MLASMVVDVTNHLGHGMARQAIVLPQRANKENSEMVRDAVVYGREATTFQRTLLSLSSRYLCLLTCWRQRKQVLWNFGTYTQNYTASNPKKIQYSSEQISTSTQLHLTDICPWGEAELKYTKLKRDELEKWGMLLSLPSCKMVTVKCDASCQIK